MEKNLNNSSNFQRTFDYSCCETKDIDENSCQIMVDNSDNILKIFKKLYDEKQMCDVYLKVAGKEYGAHRLILCGSSDVFQVMLMKPEWSEWHESTVELKELPQCENVFHLFLEYFYTGKLLITHTNVMPILALADKYIVKGLSRICLQYMCNHVPHASSHNQLFTWLQYAQSCGHNDITKICQDYIKWNFQLVANTPDFSNIDPETLLYLLKQNDLVVYNEMMLYNCVVRWLDLQKVKLVNEKSEVNIKEYMNYLVEVVMSYIRFPMMTPRELADLLLSPLIKQHKEFFVDKMSIGMSFHSGHTDRINAISLEKDGKLLFTPRLYTSDTYSSILSIENFKSIPFYHTSTFIFSSNSSAAEYECDKVNEWVIDLYPKGVWFRQCYLLVWQGTLEVPEEIVSTVRLSLTCRKMSEPIMKFKVSILVHGIEGGVEHIMDVKSTVHEFTLESRIINIDNIVSFDKLNPSAGSLSQRVKENPYLIGADRNIFKLQILITPHS
ncbi:hypothetical protein WA026_007471 [Henosepilachna vigintioctopunctata]|uniref:BTB domain-containing protein n=1 Tax=Henosepilachna vigintioctopunctata TaxID=420089 RepID=A0AAW1UV02_9CUCU